MFDWLKRRIDAFFSWLTESLTLGVVRERFCPMIRERGGGYGTLRSWWMAAR